MTIFGPTGPKGPHPVTNDRPSKGAQPALLDVGPYTEAEISEIQTIIGEGGPPISDAEAFAIGEAFAGKLAIEHLIPFAPLAARNPALFAKLAADERTKSGPAFCFFPESLPLFYSSTDPVDVRIDLGTRGLVAIVQTPSKGIVIKPHQSEGEESIAQRAADLGVGPRQLPSLPGHLTEQFIAGPKFSQLDRAEETLANVYEFGRAFGQMLRVLHNNDLFYNGQALCDDRGKSHLILPKSGTPVLIDFGRTLDLGEYGALSDAQVYRFMDTLPKPFLLQMMHGQHDPKKLVDDGRDILARITREDLLAEDVRAVNVGLGFAKGRIGSKRCDAFRDGFIDNYPEAVSIWTSQRPRPLQEWAGAL